MISTTVVSLSYAHRIVSEKDIAVIAWNCVRRIGGSALGQKCHTKDYLTR